MNEWVSKFYLLSEIPTIGVISSQIRECHLLGGYNCLLKLDMRNIQYQGETLPPPMVLALRLV